MRIVILALVAFLNMGTQALGHDTPRASHGLTIDQPWARQTGTRTMSAAVYLIIRNDSHETDTIIDAATPRAAMAQVHRSYEQDGMMRMDHVPELPVAPGETLTFAPGGYHVMLMRLTEPLKEGDVFPLTLTFARQGAITLHVEVTGIAGPQ